MNPLTHATPEQAERYGVWAERVAGSKRGDLPDFLRRCAAIARSNGEPSFYSDFNATRRSS